GNHLRGTLVNMGFIEEDKLLSFLAQQYRVPAVNLNSYQFIDPAVIKLVPIELVKKHMVLPLKRVGSNLTVAMADPTNVFGLDDLKFRTNYSIPPVIASESALLEAIKKYYGAGADGQFSEDAKSTDTSKLLEVKDYTINDLQSGTDFDLHDEGATIDVEDFDKTVGDLLDSVEVAEDEQDSGYATGALEAPIVKLVNDILQLDMTKLGLEDQQRDRLKPALAAPYGMILVTGPTGSGNTTTLYSALQALNTPSVNICTAEDPIEFNFMGINQVQVHPDIGLTFAAALKAFLRQDPDIIMIGEIRDYETGEIGVKSALTGHLVLASLHT